MEGLYSVSTKARMRRLNRENVMATLIVAHPGPLRDGMEALLASMPRVRVIGKVGSIDGAMRKAAVRHVGLLLVDASFPEQEVRRLLRRYLAAYPGMRAIVFANTIREVERAHGLEVDAVFVTGRPADQFVSMVEDLLRQS